MTESRKSSMFNSILTFLSYAFFCLVLIGYLYFSFKLLVGLGAKFWLYLLNLIISCLLVILLIFLIASFNRFENLHSASDLYNNIYWLIVDDFGGAFKLAWIGGTAPAYTVIFFSILVIILVFFFLLSILPEGENEELEQANYQISLFRENVRDLESRIRSEEYAHEKVKDNLASRDKELSQKTRELAEISSKNNKYIKFYNENSVKVVNSEKILQAKDSKIKDLEETLKRRDFQIQRLKRARKNSEAN